MLAAIPSPCVLVKIVDIIHGDAVCSGNLGTAVIWLDGVGGTSAIGLRLRSEVGQRASRTAHVLPGCQGRALVRRGIILGELSRGNPTFPSQGTTAITGDNLNGGTGGSRSEGSAPNGGCITISRGGVGRGREQWRHERDGARDILD